jgi:hypothetical protein
VHKESIAISDPAVSLSQMNILGFHRKYPMMIGQEGVSEGNNVFRNHQGSCHNKDTHDNHNRQNTPHNLST